MQDLLKINYETEEPTVSARELYDRLNIKSNFTTWFRRMCEYGFEDGKDFFPKMEESTGGRPSEEFAMKIDMAKEICMLQRSPEGKQIRQYFIDLEKAWNTPEQVFARALKMADKTIEKLKHNNALLLEDNVRMKPKEVFADAVATSQSTILIAIELGTVPGELPEDAHELIAHFKNPAMPSVASTTDAALKIATARQGFAQTDIFLEMIGFDQADIRRIRAQEQRAKGDAILTEEFGNADNGEGVGGIHNEDVTD